MIAERSLTLKSALIAALERNRARLKMPDSFRVFHGRGGSYPGLQCYTLDFFGPVLVLTVFRGEVDEAQLTEFCDWFREQSDCELALYVQRRDLKIHALECIVGNLPDNWFAVRGGLRFHLSAHKQNLGYFLDSEPARVWLEQQCQQNENKLKILNLFAFSCSFSVVALGAGADEIVNVDMSSAVLNTGRQNHLVNQQGAQKVKFLAHDVLRSWGKLKRLGPYDIVLVDPPSFQKGSFVARRDYPKVIRKLPDLLVNGGKALLCLNDPQVRVQEFQSWVDECACPLELESILSVSDDFPDTQGGHLKMLVYRCGLSMVFPPL